MKEIVCICEGISMEVLDRYMEEGNMPNLKKMINEGASGELKCDDIPYEASCLTTALSGVSVKEHGIISYWNPKSYEYIPEEWRSEDVKEYMFWNKKEFSDNRYAIVNIFGTQPTYKINGYMLSYSMDTNLRYSYPRNLLVQLNRKKLLYVQDTCAFYTPKTNLFQFCVDVLKIDRLRKEVFFKLIEEDIDIGIVNFTAIDRISHFGFHEFYTKNSKDTCLYQAYKQCDEIIGELMQIAEKKAAKLLLFSEIGFGKLNKFVRVNDYLCNRKLFKKNDINTGVIWDKTYAFESVQGSHGVNINLKNRFKNGTVEMDEYEDVLFATMKTLEQMPNPFCDQPMFKKVIRGSDYSDAVKVPDILLEPYDWTYLPYGDSYWANHVSRDCQTGWHRPNSFWVTMDKNIGKKQIKNLLDISEYIKSQALKEG